MRPARPPFLIRPVLLLAVLGGAFVAGAAWAEGTLMSANKTPAASSADTYPPSRVCGAGALTLWECRLPRQRVALCLAAKGQGAERLQVLRADKAGRMELLAAGGGGTKLRYEMSPNGDASLEFLRDGRQVLLIDPLRGPSILEQEMHGKVQRSECRNPNQTLSLNHTVALLRALGITASP